MDHQSHHDIATRIRGAVDDVRLDPSVRARHLHAIRHRAAALPVPATSAPRSRMAGLRRLVASGATAALVLIATTGAAVAASTDALPDDSLYGVKRTTEAIRLRFAADEAAFRLELVNRRLDEAEAIVAAGGSTGGLARVLRDTGLELAAIDDDRVATAAHARHAAARLADLLSDGDLPPQASAAAHSALQHALDKAGPPDAPPGQDPDFTPPGQDPDFTPPGQDPDFTPPGQDPELTPPGQDRPGKGHGGGSDPGKGKGSAPSSSGTPEPGGSVTDSGPGSPAEAAPGGTGSPQVTPPGPPADPPGRDDDARPPPPRPQQAPPAPPSQPGTGPPDGAGPPPGPGPEGDSQEADRPGQAPDPPGKGGR